MLFAEEPAMPIGLHPDDDPIDPLAPRADDPVFFYHPTRLYDRPALRHRFFRTPLAIAAMVALTVLVALVLVLVARVAW
jgi:hypothetical protein